MTCAFSFAAQALPILPPDPDDSTPQVAPGALSEDGLEAVLSSLEPATPVETLVAAEMPEPDSLLLMAVGLAAWFTRWRRKRRAQRRRDALPELR